MRALFGQQQKGTHMRRAKYTHRFYPWNIFTFSWLFGALKIPMWTQTSASRRFWIGNIEEFIMHEILSVALKFTRFPIFSRNIHICSALKYVHAMHPDVSAQLSQQSPQDFDPGFFVCGPTKPIPYKICACGVHAFEIWAKRCRQRPRRTTDTMTKKF